MSASPKDQIVIWPEKHKEIKRRQEIEESIRLEKEKYETEKKEFYENPLHWSNNKRRMCGLSVLRGKINKGRNKNFHSFRPTPFVFFLIEDIIEETLCDKLNNSDYFDKFVDINNIDIGNKHIFVAN